MKNRLLKRRERIKKRVRSRIVRKSEYPRLSVHRSNKHIYVQVIDDHKMITLVSADDTKLSGKKMTNIEKAKKVGENIAAKLKSKKINQVVFDRGCYAYNGRVKALAEAVRNGGITI